MKKPKYVPPEYVPTPRSELIEHKCKGGPLKRLLFKRPAPAEHKVLDVGTYMLMVPSGVYQWVPNPDSPARRAEREAASD